jgi:hypothetical protein
MFLKSIIDLLTSVLCDNTIAHLYFICIFLIFIHFYFLFLIVFGSTGVWPEGLGIF